MTTNLVFPRQTQTSARPEAVADRLAEMAWLAVPTIGAFIAAIAFSRSYPNFGVETDYLWSFVPEAERILTGQPLLVRFHPPLYPLVLASVYVVVGDWFTTGLLVSTVASVVAMACGLLLFKRLLGPAVGAGAVLGFAASATFLELGASCSSDVFFLSLFMASVSAALVAVEQPSIKRWVLCGALLGLGLLTRSNALTLVMLVGAPLLVDAPPWQRFKLVLACAGGAAVPLLVWASFALASGSPLVPRGNSTNLAMTYYTTGDRISGDSYNQVMGRFDGLLDVIAHDPLRIGIIYVDDAIHLLQSGLTLLLAPPLGLFLGAGVVTLLVLRHDPVMLGFVATLAAQMLLVNFKAFDDRFFLFLVPLFGAGFFAFGRVLLAWVADRRVRRIVTGGLGLCAVVAIVVAVAQAVHWTQADQAELREAVTATRKVVPAQATMVARKPHVGFMVGVKTTPFPDVPSVRSLAAAIREMDASHPIYLYYGSVERRLRPQFAALADPANAPGEFVVEAHGTGGGGWVLYRYMRGPSMGAHQGWLRESTEED